MENLFAKISQITYGKPNGKKRGFTSFERESSHKIRKTENNKNLILFNVNVDDIHDAVNDFTNSEYFITAFIELNNSKLHSASDFIKYATNLIIVQIGTAMTTELKQLRLISEQMTYEEQINFLIDLKNVDEIKAIKCIVANGLEKLISS
ncbi:hypothetical protein [Chryseobacterium carnipullorum]|uniref:hypothetical protein n=1 Tax=Chryseobacterium carnipullorum TaxID=1124835 RepID=UPI000E9B1B0D|nr:hypothetical protein [Chryseobacterium carnipullorum]HBV16658.1 hypothetical protein [Chryseobacterium carnipullorum]